MDPGKPCFIVDLVFCVLLSCVFLVLTLLDPGILALSGLYVGIVLLLANPKQFQLIDQMLGWMAALFDRTI